MNIKKEDAQKAYDEGCEDVKKVLMNLFPDVDFEENKFHKEKIYSFTKYNTVYKLQKLMYGGWQFLCMRNSNDYSTLYLGSPTLSELKLEGDLQIFDSEIKFYKWALKQCK